MAGFPNSWGILLYRFVTSNVTMNVVYGRRNRNTMPISLDLQLLPLRPVSPRRYKPRTLYYANNPWPDLQLLPLRPVSPRLYKPRTLYYANNPWPDLQLLPLRPDSPRPYKPRTLYSAKSPDQTFSYCRYDQSRLGYISHEHYTLPTSHDQIFCYCHYDLSRIGHISHEHTCSRHESAHFFIFVSRSRAMIYIYI